MKNYYQSLGILCLFFYSFSLSAQLDSALAAGLQDILDNDKADAGITGVEATVIMPDGCSWTGVSGERAPGENVTLDRKWTFASNTKVMTTYLIMMLYELDSLDIDDPFYDYIPAETFPENVVNFPYVDSAITIRNLLNHTTNMPTMWEQGTPLWSDVWSDPCPVWDLDDVLDSAYWLEPEIEFSDDLDHEYNGNYGNYIILSYVLTSVLDATLDDIFQDYIFDPLGMEDSYLATNGIDMDDINGMYNNGNFMGDLCRSAYLSTRAGGGALISTSADVATFMRSYYSGELLSEESMNEVLTATGDPTAVPVVFCAGEIESSYGLGTMMVDLYTPASSTWLDQFHGHAGNGLGFVLSFYSSEHGYNIVMTHNDYYAPEVSQLNYFDFFLTLVCEVIENIDSECAINTSISEIDASSIMIYPNPGRDQLIIESNGDMDEIRLINAQGQYLEVQTNPLQRVEWDVSELSAGLYFIEFRSGEDTVLQKWIKE